MRKRKKKEELQPKKGVYLRELVHLFSFSVRHYIPFSKRETAREAASTATGPKFELELLTALMELLPALLEHERGAVAAAAVAEGAALERVLLLVRVGVLAAVEALAQLRVAEDLVRLVDARHLLLGLLFGEPLPDRLVRVVDLGRLAVRRLDLSLVRVALHAQHLVVVLRLAALQRDLRLLHERVDDVVLVRTGLGRLLQRRDAGLEVLGV